MAYANRFGTLFTKLPNTTKLTFSLIAFAGLSHFFGSRAANKNRDSNFKNNMNILSSNVTDWTCYYLAKQYHEECDDINRDRGLDYMEGLCGNLENKLNKCRDDLYNEISVFKPYSMEPPVKLVDPPPWIQTEGVNKSI